MWDHSAGSSSRRCGHRSPLGLRDLEMSDINVSFNVCTRYVLRRMLLDKK